MENEKKPLTRRARLGRHLRRNLVAYVALGVAVSMSPLPAYAASVAVGTSGIQNGAVTTPKLANAAVKAHKLGANSVNSSKIQDGKVLKNDLAASARGYTAIVTKRVAIDDLANGARSDVNVFCAANQIAIAGGAYLFDGLLLGGAAGDLALSVPVNPGFSPLFIPFPAGDNTTARGWRTEIRNDTGDPQDGYHYAICASK